MKILLFDKDHQIHREIRNRLKSREFCRIILVKDYDAFKKEFSFCLSGETIVVFSIDNESDLEFLEFMQTQFMDVKLIINQAENNNFFMPRLFKLHPRIIADFNENAELIPRAVLGIVEENRRNHKKEEKCSNR